MTTYTPEDFGGSVNDVIGDTNRQAIQAAINTGKDIYYPNGMYTVNGPILFTGGTRHFTDRPRGTAGINFKLTNYGSSTLFGTLDYADGFECDGLTLQVDPSSTFQTGAEITLFNANGGRFISLSRMKINGLAESNNAVFIGAKFNGDQSHYPTYYPSFNNDIRNCWFNDCDTDLFFAGESASMMNLIGFDITGNQFLSASNLVSHANIKATYCINLSISGNKFNAQGEILGGGAKNMILSNTSHVVATGNYYDAGTNGKQRIQILGASGNIQLHETMISDSEIYNYSSNLKAYSLNDVSRGTFNPTILGSVTPGNNTYAIQQGFFEIIGGKIARFWGYVAISSKDTSMSGNVQIGNFPFTPRVGTTEPTGMINHYDYVGLSSGATIILGMMYPNDNRLRLMQCFNGTAKYSDYLPVANLGNQPGFRFEFICEIA